MTLSDGDKAICMEIARQIIKEVLVSHIDSCPYGKAIVASRVFLAGLCLGSGLAGGGIVLGAVKLLGG